MTLVARQAERAIKAAARRALRADAGAWREFVRRRQRVKPVLWKVWAAFLMMVGFGLTLVCLLRRAPETRAGWVALILLLVTFTGMSQLTQFLGQRTTHLERLPIEDDDIFRVAWRDFCKSALCSVPVFYWLFSWLPLSDGEPASPWLRAGAALLLTGSLVASVSICANWLRLPALGQGVANFGWVGYVFLLNAAGDQGNAMIRDTVDHLATGVRLATPPGWVVTWFMGRAHGDTTAALWLVPVLLVFAMSVPAWRRLRATYSVPESAPRLPQMTPVQAMQMQQVAWRKELPVPRLVGETAIEESLRARELLAERPTLESGWLDRRILNRLTSRERALVDFMALVAPRWTHMWKVGLGAAALGLFLGVLLRPVRPNDFWISVIFGGAVLLITALPLANGLNRAFLPCPVAGGAPLTFAGCLPISYPEVLRLDLKISMVRLLVALPVVLVFGAAAAGLVGSPLWLGALMGLKVALGIMALRPMMVTFMFSSGTNDSQLSKLRGWVMLGAAIFVAAAVVTLGVASVMVTAWWNLISLPALALVCWVFHAVHRRCYDRMVFDLQPSTLVGQHPVG